MCFTPAAPTTLPVNPGPTLSPWVGNVGKGADLLGVAASSYSAYGQALAQRRGAEFQARQAELAAADAIERGGLEEGRTRRRAAQVRGAQTARLAAGNIDAAQGSALALLEETDRLADEDTALIRTNAGREAAAYRSGAALYRAQARDANPYLAAGTSLLTGATAVADRWYRRKQSRE